MTAITSMNPIQFGRIFKEELLPGQVFALSDLQEGEVLQALFEVRGTNSQGELVANFFLKDGDTYTFVTPVREPVQFDENGVCEHIKFVQTEKNGDRLTLLG